MRVRRPRSLLTALPLTSILKVCICVPVLAQLFPWPEHELAGWKGETTLGDIEVYIHSLRCSMLNFIATHQWYYSSQIFVKGKCGENRLTRRDVVVFSRGQN